MRIARFLVALLLVCAVGSAQSPNLWNWVSGPKTTYSELADYTNGVVGSRVFPAGGVVPGVGPVLYGGLHALDESNIFGDVWVLGGVNYSTWSLAWSPSSVYNAVGVYSKSFLITSPGARYGAFFWPAENGFFIYGGKGYGSSSASVGYLSDVWFFDFKTRSWSLFFGDGALDLPLSSRGPGGRAFGGAWSLDSGLSLALFGGEIPGNNRFGGDLWKFSWSTGTWKLQPLSPTGVNNPATTTPNLWPGARKAPCVASSGTTAYMYGGYGVDVGGSVGFLTETWMWAEGTGWTAATATLPNANASGIPTPFSTAYGYCWWDSYRSVFGLFGGEIFSWPQPSQFAVGANMDWYAFDPSRNLWRRETCALGCQRGLWGTGIYSSHTYSLSNVPSARYGGLSFFFDYDAFIYGGFGQFSNIEGTEAPPPGALSDMWRYGPPKRDVLAATTVATLVTVSTSAPTTTVITTSAISTTTSASTTSAAGGGFPIAAVVVPIVLLVLIAAVIIAIVLWRRRRQEDGVFYINQPGEFKQNPIHRENPNQSVYDMNDILSDYL